MQCSYDPFVHDHACMDKYMVCVWSFDSGATKYITSHKDLFTSLEAIPNANIVTCANTASYLAKGVGSIVLATKNGNPFTILDALYVPIIKKNILSIFSLAKFELVVKFVG